MKELLQAKSRSTRTLLWLVLLALGLCLCWLKVPACFGQHEQDPPSPPPACNPPCGRCQTCLNSNCCDNVADVATCIYEGKFSVDDLGAYPDQCCVNNQVWFLVEARNSGGSNVITRTDGDCNRTTYTNMVGSAVGYTWCLSTGGSGPGSEVVTNFATPGIYTCTFTLTATNGACSVISTSVTLSVSVVGPTSLVADQGSNPGGPTDIVDWAESGVVTVTATPNPNMSPDDLPDCWSMSGGTEVSKTVHTVPKSVACLTPIIASAGTSSRTVVVAVVDCHMSRFSRRPSCTLCTTDWGHSWWEFVLLPSAAKPLVDGSPYVQALINDSVGYRNTIDNATTGPGEVTVGSQGAADCQRSWSTGFSGLRAGIYYSYNLQQSPGTYNWLSNNCTIQEEDTAGDAGLTLCGCTTPRGLCNWLDSQ